MLEVHLPGWRQLRIYQTILFVLPTSYYDGMIVRRMALRALPIFLDCLEKDGCFSISVSSEVIVEGYRLQDRNHGAGYPHSLCWEWGLLACL